MQTTGGRLFFFSPSGNRKIDCYYLCIVDLYAVSNIYANRLAFYGDSLIVYVLLVITDLVLQQLRN